MAGAHPQAYRLNAGILTLPNCGDHVLVSDVTCEAVTRVFGELPPQKYGIERTFVDVSDLATVQAATRPDTKLVHAETIANSTASSTAKVADIGALAAIAHASGDLLSTDTTFRPPPMFRGLEQGADLAVHALSKYIDRHGDRLGRSGGSGRRHQGSAGRHDGAGGRLIRPVHRARRRAANGCRCQP
jgi:O-acetylhomoserine/O-acetylserine sulfhydrylase-like pyridoxal-dependent enzyme